MVSTCFRNRALAAVLLCLSLMAAGVVGQGVSSYVYVSSNYNQMGDVYAYSPSQILPATYLTFDVPPNAFLEASPDNPVIIQITLPANTVLTRTLATGRRTTTAPLPSNGETVWDLAVVEYDIGNEVLPIPVASSAATQIDPHAVQLFRYVAGESNIQIRITASTENWIPDQTYHFLGFTIGIGGDYWPPFPQSSLGPGGEGTQPSTLFQADIRDYSFSNHDNVFPVELTSFYQRTTSPTSTYISPSIINLFTLRQLLTDEIPISSSIGGTITAYTVADLNMDGLDDVVSLDGRLNRLYWAFGQPDGTFGEPDWRETVATDPLTVAVADVSGDSRPDILIGDASGNLFIYFWEDLFAKEARLTKVATPTAVLKTPGTPSDSTIQDLDKDGFSDYLFTDEVDDTLNVMFGGGFTIEDSYSTGASPVALTTGDFNGDGNPDVAVANKNSHSVTVYANDGSGQFSQVELQSVGQGPVDIEAADFNRDGAADLAVALQQGKALAVLKAQSGGSFDPTQAQTIFFQNTPSAILARNYDAKNGPDVLLGYSDFSKLSLCTSNEAGNLVFAYNIDTLGDVVVDPNNNVVLSEDHVLSVAGGTGYGGVSSREGVAAITQQSFNVVHFPRSRNISFSVVNLGNVSALLNLELYSDTGVFRSTNTQSIAPHSQFARYFPELLGSASQNSDSWVRAFITEPNTYGMWLVNDAASLTYLDGTKIPDIREGLNAFVFAALQTGGSSYTTFYLINPHEDDAHATLRVYSPGGALKQQQNALIPARGRLVLDAGSAFSGIATGDYVAVSCDRSLLGTQLFGDDRSIAALQFMPSGVGDGSLYCPHVAQGDLGHLYSSRLTLINTTDTAANVSVTLYSDAGVQLGALSMLPIAPHAKQERELSALLPTTPPYTGFLVIDTRGSTGIVGHITFGDASGGEFLSALPLQRLGHNDFLMGHIANGTLGSISYFTGLAILNPEPVVKTIKISAYNQAGILLNAKNLTLTGNKRSVFLLNDFMPGVNDIFGGYIHIENISSGSGILVFQLFGDDQLTFLSAVPAIPLD